MDWEEVMRMLTGGAQTPTGLQGPTDAGMPTQPQVPVIPGAALPPTQQAGPAAQPGAAPMPVTPTSAAGSPTGQPPGQALGVASGTPGSPLVPGDNPMGNRPTLSPEMMRALAMMMSPGEAPRVPGAPAPARPSVQPFLQPTPGVVTTPGRAFGPRRGF